MKSNYHTCGICGYTLYIYNDDLLKKLGNFSQYWWQWILMFLIAGTNLAVFILIYLLLSKKYCPSCRHKFYKYAIPLVSEGRNTINNLDESEDDIYRIVNDYHYENVEGIISKIDNLTSIKDLKTLWKISLKEYRASNGNLVKLEECVNKIIDYIDSRIIKFDNKQNIITYLSISFIVFNVSESAMYIAYLIVKYLWEDHKELFKKENDNYVWCTKFQTLEDDENIFQNLGRFKCKLTDWVYFYNDLIPSDKCNFLFASVNQKYTNLVSTFLADLSLPSSWNANSFEEFIKIINSRNDVSNLKEDYTNYYKILNLDSDATISEIKKAYKDLIAKYHPDVCKEIDADKKTIELNKAYEILSDVKLKKEYDEMYF